MQSTTVRPAMDPIDSSRETRLLQTLALSTAQAETLDEALASVLEGIGETTGWITGESWLPSVSGRTFVRGPTWSQDEHSLDSFHQVSQVRAFASGAGIVGQVWASGQAAWFDDISHEPLFVRADAAREVGLRTAAAIPVLAGAEVAAVLVFYHMEARAQDPALLALVSAVAAQLGMLIRRRQAEEALLRKTEELSRANEELERFIWLASHDLNEPLRMVALYTQLLGDRLAGRLAPDEEEAVMFAVEGARRMHTLLEDFRAYAEAGNRAGRAEEVRVDQALARALDSLEPRLHESGTAIDIDPMPVVMAGVEPLTQVFEHLLANALTYRNRSSETRVHITARRHGAYEWIIAVQDNGIGIPPEQWSRIFEPFHRGHDRAAYPGTGVGLAICRKIVEGYGGRIWVESEEGLGSTFCVRLPAA
ncbi:MAG TPA: ATP-binding protein [Longimicrobiaceae bacterium]